MATKCDIVMIVIPGDLDCRYDRRVDPGFLDLFDARGAFRTLTEYARKARYPVDLQFRRNPKTAAQHASLYVGLTTVLDVHWKPGTVKLAAHPSFHPSGFQAAWMSWTAIGEAAARADAVDGYLDAVIPKAAAGRAAVEGAVQAAVSSFDSANRVMLDREVLLHFRDTPTKQRVMDRVTADLLAALRRRRSQGRGLPHWAAGVTFWQSIRLVGSWQWRSSRRACQRSLGRRPRPLSMPAS